VRPGYSYRILDPIAERIGYSFWGAAWNNIYVLKTDLTRGMGFVYQFKKDTAPGNLGDEYLPIKDYALFEGCNSPKCAELFAALINDEKKKAERSFDIEENLAELRIDVEEEPLMGTPVNMSH
jgi:hypothetical protein